MDKEIFLEKKSLHVMTWHLKALYVFSPYLFERRIIGLLTWCPPQPTSLFALIYITSNEGPGYKKKKIT